MISVVIPCHNYGRFLGEAVASVERQSRPADELVVVDDGSTDETATIVAELARSRPRLVTISRTPARGAAATFNDAVRASHGDLVVILSADDRLSPEYLARCEAALVTDAAADFAYCSSKLFGAVERVDPAPPFDARRLMRRNFLSGSSMFRRAMFDRVGGFREDIPWEDWEFWVHAVATGSHGVAVEGCWLEYRKHEAGSRNTMPQRAALEAHRQLRQLHPGAVRRRDFAVWVTQGAVKRARRAIASSAR